jgi:hypothetical protein
MDENTIQGVSNQEAQRFTGVPEVVEAAFYIADEAISVDQSSIVSIADGTIEAIDALSDSGDVVAEAIESSEGILSAVVEFIGGLLE